jgi:ribonuclease HI
MFIIFISNFASLYLLVYMVRTKQDHLRVRDSLHTEDGLPIFRSSGKIQEKGKSSSSLELHAFAIPEEKIIGWFDGAAQQNGDQSGAGGVIKINEHTTYKWTLNCGHGTNTRAELLGVWASLTLASRLSITDFLVLGDSKIVIDWLNRKGALQVVTLDCWKDRIYELIKSSGLYPLLIFSEKRTKRLIAYQNRLFKNNQGS